MTLSWLIGMFYNWTLFIHEKTGGYGIAHACSHQHVVTITISDLPLLHHDSYYTIAIVNVFKTIVQLYLFFLFCFFYNYITLYFYYEYIRFRERPNVASDNCAWTCLTLRLALRLVSAVTKIVATSWSHENESSKAHAMREIKYYMKTTHLLLPKLLFSRLCQSMLSCLKLKHACSLPYQNVVIMLGWAGMSNHYKSTR